MPVQHVRRPVSDTRPDASMMLLNDIFAQPLDPDYAAAAQRRADEAEAALDAAGGADAGDGTTAAVPRRRVSPLLLVSAAAIGLLLAAGLVTTRSDAATMSAERSALISRITSAQESTAELQARLGALEAEVVDLQDEQLGGQAASAVLRERTERLRTTVGTTAVTGPGIVLTLDDAPDARSVDGSELGAVLDLDLQHTVNGLWAAGAEAISINGQRITPLTAIRAADRVIQVNYQPLNPPYEIRAIGDDRVLASRFSEGVGGQWLRAASDAGITFSVRNSDEIEIPAGSASLRYARPVETT